MISRLILIGSRNLNLAAVRNFVCLSHFVESSFKILVEAMKFNKCNQVLRDYFIKNKENHEYIKK